MIDEVNDMDIMNEMISNDLQAQEAKWRARGMRESDIFRNLRDNVGRQMSTILTSGFNVSDIDNVVCLAGHYRDLDKKHFDAIDAQHKASPLPASNDTTEAVKTLVHSQTEGVQAMKAAPSKGLSR